MDHTFGTAKQQQQAKHAPCCQSLTLSLPFLCLCSLSLCSGDALDLSPLDGGLTILTGSWRPHECLQRWDLASGRLLDTVPFAAGPGGLGGDRPELLYAAAFSPDGKAFAAGGCGTNETKLFANTPPAAAAAGAEARPPSMLERVSAGTGGVYCLAFAPSGKKLAMGGGGKSVIVVDL
jgi:WD40 repeat protein